MLLVINNELIYAPVVKAQILDGISALNRGDLSIEKLKEFQNIISKVKIRGNILVNNLKKWIDWNLKAKHGMKVTILFLNQIRIEKQN